MSSSLITMNHNSINVIIDPKIFYENHNISTISTDCWGVQLPLGCVQERSLWQLWIYKHQIYHIFMAASTIDISSIESIIQEICHHYDLSSEIYISMLPVCIPQLDTDQQDAINVFLHKTVAWIRDSILSKPSDDTNKSLELYCEKLHSQIESLRSQLEQSRSELGSLQSEHTILLRSSSPSIDVTRIEQEKLELAQLVEKKSSLLSISEQEVTFLTTKLTNIKKEFDQLTDNYESVQSEHVIQQTKYQQLEQSFNHSKQQASQLSAILKDLQEEYQSYRKDRSTQLAQLQTNLSTLESKYNVQQQKMSQQSLISSQLQEKFANLQSKYQESQTYQIEQEESFKREMSTQSKLVQLYKSTISELNDQLLTIQREHEQSILAFQSQIDSLNQQTTQLGSIIQSRDEEISALQRLTDTNDRIISPTAHSLANTPLTDLIKDNTRLSNELQVSRKETERLQLYLKEICQEITDKSAQLEREHEEYEELKNTLSMMSRDLEHAIRKNDSLVQQYERIRNDHDEQNSKTETLEQQKADLSRQVSVLLARIENVPLDNDDNVPSLSNEIIDKKLITFEDITELQSKNEQLITLVRELVKKQEEYEKNIDTDIIRERDDLKRQMDTLRERTVPLVADKEPETRVDYDQFNTDKLKHKLELANERLEMIKEQFDMQSKQLDDSRERIQVLHEQSSQLQVKLAQMMEDLINSKGEEQRSRQQSISLQEQVGFLQSSYNKLLEDFQSNSKEKLKLSNMISQLTESRRELEKDHQEEKKSLMTRIDKLEEEIVNERKNTRLESDNTRLAQHKLDRERESYQWQLQQLNNEKDKLVNHINELNEKIVGLETRLNDSEKRIDLLLSIKQSKGNIKSVVNANASSDDNREILDEYVNLQKTIDALGKDNDRLKDQEIVTKGQLGRMEREYESIKENLKVITQERDNIREQYDMLKIELDNNIDLVNEKNEQIEDMKRHVEIIKSDQLTYELEVKAHAADLERLKTCNSTLERVQLELKEIKEQYYSMEVQLEQDKLMVESKEKHWMERISLLEQRNIELGKQIEQSDTIMDKDTIYNSLKRERDLIQMELDTSNQETRRLNIQIQMLTNKLNDAKEQPWAEKMHQENQALLEKVEQLAILRESNITLRHENQSQSKQLASLEERYRTMTKTMEPLKEELLEVKSQLVAFQSERERMERELISWREKVPEDTTELKEQVNLLKNRSDALIKKLKDMRANKEELQTRFNEVNEQLQAMNQKYEDMVEKMQDYDELNIKVKEYEDSISNLKEEQDSSIVDLEQVMDMPQVKSLPIQDIVVEEGEEGEEKEPVPQKSPAELLKERQETLMREIEETRKKLLENEKRKKKEQEIEEEEEENEPKKKKFARITPPDAPSLPQPENEDMTVEDVKVSPSGKKNLLLSRPLGSTPGRGKKVKGKENPQ